ncbi:MAG: DUF1328 domain-containing protein [Nitrospira sp.]|nr:DUF1328 domain-containing protein [Nitrospira sp.]
MFLKWAAIFFVIAMVAAAFGFSGIAEGASDVAEISSTYSWRSSSPLSSREWLLHAE